MTSSTESAEDEPTLKGEPVSHAIRMAQESIDGYASSELRESAQIASDDQAELEGLSAVLDLIGSLGQKPSLIDGQETAAPLKIGRYEVLGERGRGGFGIVLHAFDTLLEREVALKIPKPERLLAGQALDEMVREARVVARLSHPGIVQVYEVRQLGPVWYIASDFCDGPTLAEWLESQGKQFSPRLAAQVLAQVAEAVHYAHARGILHLDLKPENILFNSEGEEATRRPMVTDFGLAHGDAESPESPRRIGGTLAYMAPEQKAKDAERIGVATDVYALGVILLELLGISLQDGGERSGVDSRLNAFAQTPTAIPRDLQAICNLCLADDPNDRYQSAHDLASDLRRHLNGEPVAARPLTWLQTVASFCRRKPFATSAIVALLAILVGSYVIVVAAWQKAESHLEAVRVSEHRRQEATNRMEDSLLSLAGLAQEATLRVPHTDDETGVAIPGMRRFFNDVRQWAESDSGSSQSTEGLLAAINSLSLVQGIGSIDDAAFEGTFRDGLYAWLALIRYDPHDERWHKALALHLFTYKLRQGDGEWLSWRSSALDINEPTRRKVERPYALLLVDYASIRLRQRDAAASYGMIDSALEILDDDQSLFSQDKKQHLHWLITAHQQAAAAAAHMSQPEKADLHFAALTRIAADAPSPTDCDARSAASIADVLVNQWRRGGQSESDEALELLHRARDYGRKALQVAPSNPDYVNALSRQHRFIGSIYRKRGQAKACLNSLNEAKSILDQGLANSSNDRETRIERARLATLIGEEHLLGKEPLNARRHFECATEDFDAVQLMHTDTRGTWLIAGRSLQSLGKLYASEERLEESVEAYRRSIELMTMFQTFRKHHRAEALIKQARQEIKTLTQDGQR